MKHLALGTALMAALYSGIAGAQGPSQPPHAGQGMKEAAPAKAAPPPAAIEGSNAKGRSPFEDYRPFTPQEPSKNWRAANDGVRDIGGHIGLMKKAKDDAAQAPKGSKP